MKIFSGLMPEVLIKDIQQFMQRLEGLFRLFSKLITDVKRDTDGVLQAALQVFKNLYAKHKSWDRVHDQLMQAALYGVGDEDLKVEKLASALGSRNAVKKRVTMSQLRIEETLQQETVDGVDDTQPPEPVAAAPAGQAEDEDQPTPWFLFLAQSLVRVQKQLLSELLDRRLIAHFVEWCQTPCPRRTGFAYNDCIVIYLSDEEAGENTTWTTITNRSPEENIYMGNPVDFDQLADPVLQSAMDRMMTFYSQTFWAMGQGLRVCMCALALAKRGLNIDQMYFFGDPEALGYRNTHGRLQTNLGMSYTSTSTVASFTPTMKSESSSS